MAHREYEFHINFGDVVLAMIAVVLATQENWIAATGVAMVAILFWGSYIKRKGTGHD
jgi:hypothetical protein